MNLFKIAWRSVQQRRLSSALTGLSMALGVALVVIVLVILNTVEDTFRKNSGSWDMILGAKGSKLQVVLNTVYHLSTPVENVPYSFYKEWETKFQSPIFVSQLGNVAVIPVCMGDSYQGHRVVATIPRMFQVPYAGNLEYEFAAGRAFKDIPGNNEAVAGSVAAHKLGLKVNDKIRPAHGISDETDLKDHDAFTVVGVLAPTGTPNDRAIFINMESFYLQEGHALSEELANQRAQQNGQSRSQDDNKEPTNEDQSQDSGDQGGGNQDAGEQATASNRHWNVRPVAFTENTLQEQEDGQSHAGHGQAEALPEELREVTAILIRFDPEQTALSSMYSMKMVKDINKGNVAQAVLPLKEITDLFNTFIGPLKGLLMFLAVLIVVVAGIGIMVGIYNTMNDRRRDIAVMRALGAGQVTVMAVILFESLILAVGGGLFGFLLGHVAVGIVSSSISGTTGVEIPMWFLTWQEMVLLPGLVILAALAGFWPALSAYRTDVSKSLTATP
ncbi:MAG: ABC transporter permease [Pirellulales bacterium]|nr:ABC transporter permease [Pirellulales bacterium]